MSIQRYVLALFAVLFFLKFLTQGFGILGRVIALSVELFSLCTIALVLMQLAAGRRLWVPSRFVILFLFFAISCLFGAFANQVQPGAVFSGIRNMLMYMPFFLIPLVFTFTEEDISRQLKVLMAFAVIQLPFAIKQWSIGTIGLTWDHVSGTLLISSYLSIFLISCTAVAWSYYMAGRLKLPQFLLLMVLFLTPTTMNETKGTFILLPFAFLAPAFVKAIHQRNYALLGQALILVAGMGVLFAAVFTVMLGDDLSAFFADGDFMGYLYSGIDENAPRDWGVFNEVGRIDSILFAVKYICVDVIHFFFGYGLGNVSESFLEVTLGNFEQYAHLGPQISTVSLVLWELGTLGLIQILVGCIFIAKDAYYVGTSRSALAPLAIGWVGIVFIYIFVLPYKNILLSDVNGILFWYFSGLIVAERCRLQAGMPTLNQEHIDRPVRVGIPQR